MRPTRKLRPLLPAEASGSTSGEPSSSETGSAAGRSPSGGPGPGPGRPPNIHGATSSSSTSELQQTVLSGLEEEKAPKRKRIGTQVACNDCRRRKARCDGQRPTCASCQHRGVECTYASLQRRTSEGPASEAEEFLNLLRSVSNDEALAMLRIIRGSRETSPLLPAIQDAVSDSVEKTRHNLGHQFLDLESGLMADNPISYPALQPPHTSPAGGTSSTPLAFLPAIFSQSTSGSDIATSLRPESRSKTSLQHESSAASREHAATGGKTGYGAEPSVPGDHSESHQYCDDRLKALDISFWTNVPVPSRIAAGALSLYLQTDHPLLGTFDPDLFLEDLVSHRTRISNHFLVNAALYWACAYSYLDKTVNQYLQPLCDEAEQYWELEDHDNKLANLVGLQLLSLAYLGQGKDHYVIKYTTEAFHMGVRMSLFGVEPSLALKQCEKIPEALRVPSSYAAWGVFNWIILMTLFYQQPGLSYPEHAPVLPIPDPSDGNLSHIPPSGAAASQSPERRVASYMGYSLPALCKFWRIMQGVTQTYHEKGEHNPESPSNHVSLDYAELKYRELMAWVETLPQPLTRSNDSPHHVVIFHIWLHAAVLDIFRPFLRKDKAGARQLSTFYAEDNSPDAIFQASVNQLKHLVVFYGSQYASSAYNLLWHTALIYITNAVLQDTEDAEWRFYFRFCIYSYEALRNTYPLAETIGRALLAMALRNGNLDAGEAHNLVRTLRQKPDGDSASGMRATFMADLGLAMTDPDEARTENLAHRLEDLALFDQFTNMDTNE